MLLLTGNGITPRLQQGAGRKSTPAGLAVGALHWLLSDYSWHMLVW